MPEFLHGVEFVEVETGFRPIQVVRTSIIGLVGTAPKGEVNKPVLVRSLKEGLATFEGTANSEGFTIPQALRDIFIQGSGVGMIIVVNVFDPERHTEPEDVTKEDIIGGVGENERRTGIEALLDAEYYTGYKPRILVAPGWAHDQDVADALIEKASALRGMAILEVETGKTPSEAIQRTQTLGSERAILLYPYLVNDGVPKPPSAAYAGVMSRTDNELGFWYSPSNKLIYGFDALDFPIDFRISDPDSYANILNEHRIATFIAYMGWRTWGNYSTTADSKWKFISTRRIVDVITDTIEMNILSFIDRPITKAFLEDLQDFENAYLNTLKGRDAVIEAVCYIKPEDNPPEQLANGQVVVDLVLTPVYPAERITHQIVLDIEPLRKLFE